MPLLPRDGLVAVVKAECETCQMTQPVLAELAAAEGGVTVFSQDDPLFPAGLEPVDDTALERSFHLDIEIVPTLIRFQDGAETGRAVGWHRGDWESVSGRAGLGQELPASRPGCGSRTRDPGAWEHLAARYGKSGVKARAIDLGEWDDEIESCFDRGWSDGLPVVPPTDARIMRMLEGTTRKADEELGLVPPNLTPITVEKVAINAVMAGCRPEYLPVVLTALEAALTPEATMHGVLCTTCFSSPILVVNGPIAKRIDMNSGVNCLGQGNRANATIGRALQLIIRNVGGGRPGELDRAVQGGPGKFTFCFAEKEDDPTWTPLNVARGFEAGSDTVTLFQGDGIQGFIDQRSRTPEELTRSLARSLMAVGNWKLCEFTNAMLVLAPEHYAIFKQAGWRRPEIEAALREELKRPGADVIQGAHGIGEGVAPSRA